MISIDDLDDTVILLMSNAKSSIAYTEVRVQTQRHFSARMA